MTNEKNLTEEFYDTFWIEKIETLNYTEKGFIEHIYNYPDITSEKLLQMICILNYIMPCIDDCIIPVDYLGLKSVVLDKMIRYEPEVKQIQQLFKDEQ